VNAAYINFNKQLSKKWGVQAGLRYENTNYEGFQYGNPTKQDSSFSRSYDSWFPTIYVSYKASDAHQFSASFGRSIDRPAYQDLNPFLFFIDKYTYGQGNPYLKPQYSNNYEASHIYKGIITTTINYGSTSDLFVETFDQPDSQNGYNYATIVRQGNIGKMENAGVSVNAQLQPAKWFSSNLYANYNYSKYDGMINGELVKVEAGNMVVSVNNQFKFNKGWSAELSGWYRSKGLEGQLTIDPMGALSAGIAKQVLKGKGSIKLNLRDMFYTQIAKGDINFKSTEASFENRRDTRVANLTFTYRFGKPLNGNGQRKKSSATEEQNRVKTGG
jgi:outer membrane receptor protein involved in Fe transport